MIWTKIKSPVALFVLQNLHNNGNRKDRLDHNDDKRTKYVFGPRLESARIEVQDRVKVYRIGSSSAQFLQVQAFIVCAKRTSRTAGRIAPDRVLLAFSCCLRAINPGVKQLELCCRFHSSCFGFCSIHSIDEDLLWRAYYILSSQTRRLVEALSHHQAHSRNPLCITRYACKLISMTCIMKDYR